MDDPDLDDPWFLDLPISPYFCLDLPGGYIGPLAVTGPQFETTPDGPWLRGIEGPIVLFAHKPQHEPENEFSMILDHGSIYTYVYLSNLSICLPVCLSLSCLVLSSLTLSPISISLYFYTWCYFRVSTSTYISVYVYIHIYIYVYVYIYTYISYRISHTLLYYITIICNHKQITSTPSNQFNHPKMRVQQSWSFLWLRIGII